MARFRNPLPFLLTVAIAAAPRADAAPAAPDAPFWTGKPNAASFEKKERLRLAAVQAAVDRLLAAPSPRTIPNTLQPYDEALRVLDQVGNEASLLQNVHPDAALRASAEKVSQEVQAVVSRLSLDRRVYDALSALDLAGADAKTRYYVERTLRDFRLAGVSKDEETRTRIQALRDELVLVGQEFARNIRSDVRTVAVKDVAELDGLPADYIARHKPGPDGVITLSTDYPDSIPVFTYATNDDLRRRMYLEYNNRAYPANGPVLDRLIARRHELAGLLGFSSWADYITADKMVGSARKASEFIDRIVAASAEASARDYQALLARKQREVPGATRIEAWEKTYWSERLRKSDYSFDSQTVRPYFAYDRVKQGVLDVTGRLFGVTYRRVPGAPVWHPSVECWEMLEGGQVVGRLYLDMHPRKDKYKHAAAFPIRTGIAGRQIPETALVCNFPGGEPNDAGLMEHDDVQTFFHEFGHLIHSLFAGRQAWAGIGGISTEQDFVEAPSQMLEEWAWDPATLATFARHKDTGEPIPAPLVTRMRRASEFGKALDVRRQMVYARLSLSVHDRKPADVNVDEMARAFTREYQPFPFVEETHFQTAFGHLDGYSAVYYTYMWSLVIAKDLFSQFDRRDLLSPSAARRYRETILAAGGSAPAGELVSRFLGRPFGFKAWQDWLNEGVAEKAGSGSHPAAGVTAN